ncbi:MAG: hypothetical protein A3B91_02935 [Candidatus Yanofskybacteria bacterium RIFCSPHIGHO2_02_FULL_41_29]|uniref:THIF-type NAD/FAD binding fold domain-containing protein n=1 Tax=Candidatus Yanofskybacteria bacterium RIFCSPHIGHO2_01_FULL_41_53 TaxID=1802663 RepID=A0A1F8EJT0_9BACT|nr:MAG: hypothetical protein A2650_02285 [Candidatus Yanofskybacteria bacterium RIFCSPHIGHO2_01_FULL_41_53]OGN12219.1 MAG: hypothetical protein A3B91_02935 [Candidatus Yanofskybacteria bacterium RIFCSPHIGHO2_02_FULL_41_29]OGN18961.1 MAG: hypothetical protein A3F48_03880 [Candidatus Yanofskybacteria bacterium RIFCSPHIGHO2_12_FULL_41_9]OGN23833.1 MAG: hypothetical protein A2916_01215 [Candidatus Yanofskybacteria bacterium RIFCSPLOWO2_01_FULL_41_67]OGN28569.1 MAG: hypothetical protein A3H54_04920 
MKPTLIKPDNQEQTKLLTRIKKSAFIVDEIKEQIKELELVKNPKLLIQSNNLKLSNLEPSGLKSPTIWVYYPWRNMLVHCLNKKDFIYVRTSRNHNLITEDEQNKFEKFKVGIAGLNVGNPGAVCLALEGDIKMKLADNDVLSLSNLNRFRAGLPDLGLNKAVLTARQIYEINPFAELEVFDKGLSEDNLEKFLLKPKIDILVEEMDNLPLKIKIRELARKNGIPVVMVTGNSENVIVDIERFDLSPRLPLMSGYLKKEVIESVKAGPKSFNEKIKLARDFMGVRYLHPRLVESFRLVGSKLAGIPQIAESSFLRGAAICHFVRRIAQKDSIKSGRYYLEPDKIR